MVKFNQVLDRALSSITAVVIVLMMLHVVAHALLRFFFNAPIYGTNEIVAYWYLPAIALLGIPAAQLQREHITVTIAVERMSSLGRTVFTVFGCALGFLVSIGFAWFGFHEALENMHMGSTAGVTDIITWPIYFLVPVVFVLLAVLYVIDALVALRTGDPDIDPLTGEEREEALEDALV